MLLAPGPLPDPCKPEAGEVPAGLFDCTDNEPGITRVRRGKSFSYRDTKCRWIRDEVQLGRIRKLAIPPAYESVWICESRNRHLLAPVAMHGAASNTVTTRSGASSATAASILGCWSSV